MTFLSSYAIIITMATPNNNKAPKTLIELQVHRTAQLVAALAMAAEMEGLAKRDKLTGLFNRHSLEEHFEKLKASNRRAKNPRHDSLLVADMDHFKSINDKYGHVKGDEVLRTVGETMLARSRVRDVPFRLGGEEVGVLLPATDIIGAAAAAENLRKTIQNTNIDGIGQITASIGVVQLDYSKSLEANIDEADKALYQAKDRGRNVVVAVPSQPPVGKPIFVPRIAE